VHPSKREIKFFNGQQVYQAMATAIEQALSRAQQDMGEYARIFVDNEYQKPYAGPADDRVNEPAMNTPAPSNLFDAAEGFDPVPSQTPDGMEDVTGKPPAIPDGGAACNHLKIIGQVMGTYIIAESDRGMVMIDQHAAHERIVYEKLKNRYQSLTVQSQQLLVPQTLEFNYREFDLVKSLLPELESFGFTMEPFGGTTVVIKAVPAIIESKDIQSVLLDMIEAMLEKKDGLSKEKWLDDCLMLMACHTAIRARQTLHLTEIQTLLEELDLCENSRHCPHGRPIMISWDKEKIEKLFKRIV
jgi:DNA mismatch repair protein MutL